MRLAGRFKATGALDAGAAFVWGVHFTGTALFASDMLNGLVKLAPLTR
jgi:hypothetical protein